MGVTPLSTLYGALLLALAGSAAADTQIKLFDFPGADRTGLLGINDRGVAVGEALVVPQNGFPFTLNLRTGELNALTAPPGDIIMVSNGINNDGVITGVIFNSDGLTGPGFILQPDGSFTFFSNPQCITATDARAINENGLVTGSCNTTDGTVGFLYNSKTGKFRKIAPAPLVFMHGINVHGTAVGQAMFPAKIDPCGGGPKGATLIEYGLVRYPDGSITLFQVNRQQTDAGDIDDDGRIVGSVFDPIANTDRLYAIRVEREPCHFRTLRRSKLLSPTDTEVFVTGVNDHGRVVGIAFVSGEGPHGFYRTLPD